MSEPLQVGFILWMKGEDDLFYFLVFTIKILNLNCLFDCISLISSILLYIYIYILSFYFNE